MSVSRVGKRELKELRVVTKNKKILFLLLPLFSRCERDFQIKRETEREATEIIFLFLISNTAGVDVTREG